MAPSQKALNDAIQKIVSDMWFGNEKHDISVTNVRARLEKQFKLDNGSLKTAPSWDTTKSSIKTEATKYIDAEEAGTPIPPPKPELSSSPVASRPAPAKKAAKPEPANKGTKRSSNGNKPPPKKRQKKAATPSDEEEDSESPLSEAEDTAEESELSDFSEAPPPKKAKKPASKPAAAPKRPQKRKPESDDDEDVEQEDSKSAINVAAPKKKELKKPESDEESPLSDLQDDEPEDTENAITTQKKGDDSDSDMSILIDEGPKPKRARKSGSSEKSSKPKPSSSSSSKPKTTAELSPDEAELKTLQAQLVKCGIRKIWGMELKKFGDDMKGKIKHLKTMLRDAGMDGRFSEAKAREIKEARELKAELEAVVEGEQHWGMASGGRSKKSKTRSKEVESGDEDEDEEEEDIPPPRVPRAKMDLAFLGDESESE